MHRLARYFSQQRPAPRGSALVGLIVIGGFVGGCLGDDHPESHATSGRPASAMIFNAAPGQGTAAPMAAGPSPPMAGDAIEATTSALSVGAGGALILYDASGPYGALGELYGIGAANLASHFGAWTAKKTSAYTCGELATFSALALSP